MIIDCRFSAPTPEGLAEYVTPPAAMQGYAAIYGPRVYGGVNERVAPMTGDALIAFLDELGVDIALLKSFDNETTRRTKYPMDRLATYLRGHEDRLIGTAGVDPHKGMGALKELEWAVRDLGFRAVNVGPIAHRLRADDRRYYPIYAKATELGIPVLIHSSIHFSSDLEIDVAHPRHIDRVAADFPTLQIVCVHGGWPWVLETVALAWRHPNVFIEISGIRTKYLAQPGTGWEPLMTYGNSVIQDKILWGSNWPQIEPRESIESILSFPLKDEVKEKWLGLNAARMLGVPSPTAAESAFARSTRVRGASHS